MKILLIAACTLALVLVAVVVIGSLLPRRHTASRSADYSTTPERLFSLIEGPQNWRPDVVRCEAVPSDNGRELMRETSRRGETLTYEVSDRVPPRSITRRIVTQGLPYSGSWTYSLQPSGSGTTVRITEDGEIYNPVFRFMSRFVIGQTHTMDAYLRALGKATGQEVEVKD
jgi:hypothetical protein